MRFSRRNTLLLLAAASTPAILPVRAAAAGTLDQVRERGALRVGVTQAPPWYVKDPMTGEWSSGLGVSLGKAMAEALGVTFEPVEVTWGTAVAALQGNRIDLMYVLDATEERRAAIGFPENPLLYYSLAVLARDDLEVAAWDDLNRAGIRISVPQATSMDGYLTENLPNADIQRFPGNPEAIAAFQAGRVDAVCLFHPPLLAARQRLGRGKIVVPTPTVSRASSVGVRQEDDRAFVEWVDTMISEYYASGQTQAWYEEFLAGFGLDPAEVPPIMIEMLQ